MCPIPVLGQTIYNHFAPLHQIACIRVIYMAKELDAINL